MNIQNDRNLQIILPNLRAEAPYLVAVTGSVHGGKTTRIKTLFDQLKIAGFEPAGFIESAVFSENVRIGYDFVDLQNGDRCAVARKSENAHPYEFFENSWGWVQRSLIASEVAEVLFVDELGKLEARNEGIMPELLASLRRKPRHVIASVRFDVLENIEKLLGTFNYIIRVNMN